MIASRNIDRLLADCYQHVNCRNFLLFLPFQEAWDYIGSSRTLYEMDKDRFPRKLEKSVTLPKLIKLGHISHLIELRQLGKRDQGKLWMHTDPISKKSKWISDQVCDTPNRGLTFWGGGWGGASDKSVRSWCDGLSD